MEEKKNSKSRLLTGVALGCTIFFTLLAIVLIRFCQSRGLYSTDFRESTEYLRTVSRIAGEMEDEISQNLSDDMGDFYFHWSTISNCTQEMAFFLTYQWDEEYIQNYYMDSDADLKKFTNVSRTGSYDAFLEEMKDNDRVDWGFTYHQSRLGFYFSEGVSESAQQELVTAINYNLGPPMVADVSVAVYFYKDVDSWSMLGQAYRHWQDGRIYVSLSVASAIAAIFFGALLVMKFREIRYMGRRVAKMMSYIFLEIKLAAVISLLGLCLSLMGYYDAWFFVGLLALALVLYALVCDVYHNRKGFWEQSILKKVGFSLKKAAKAVVDFFRYHEMQYTFQKRSRRRLTRYSIIVLIILFFMIVISDYMAFAMFWLALLIVIIGMVFSRSYMKTLNTLGKTIDFVHEVRKGNYDYELYADTKDELRGMCQDLIDIQAGLKDAVEDSVRSERMKVELITNVSHDLKTPLTSIINYVDLLAKENLEPEHANEYVKILEQKSQRLSVLMQDLFDVSKANTGNIEVNMAYLNLSALLEQILAEMEEKIVESGLHFRVSKPENGAPIYGDGEKLYRVFENILSNIFKYSLRGTRVYIDVVKTEAHILVSFKNIANYEMNFEPEQVTERFLRGDTSRSTEGSGLGLSIAKSFVEIQGGEMSVTVDGDLFKISLLFDRREANEGSGAESLGADSRLSGD